MTETGIWSKSDTAGQHVFSLNFARWIGNFLLRDRRVVDMGCGFGDYLWLWSQMGFSDLLGVEGADLEDLFSHEHILIHDLSEPLELDAKGSVVAIEIGEHIPSQFESIFLDNVCNNVAQGCYLVLTWAIPGQSGHGHCNNRPNEWVIAQVEQRGLTFMPRESISARDCIEHTTSWLRNTILIFKKDVE